jgi:phosphate transport system permease protein
MTTTTSRPNRAPFIDERVAARQIRSTPGRTPIRPRDFRAKDYALLLAAAAAAYCAVWIVFYQLTLLSGTVGFILAWVLAFLVIYLAVNIQVNGRRVAVDRLVAVVVTLGGLCMFLPLVLLVVYLVTKGIGLLSFHLFSGSQAGVEVVCVKGLPCAKPGLLNAIVGTLEQIAGAVVIGVPAGVLTAVYLTEVGGRMTTSVRVVITAMSGVPAILAGAFVYAFWVNGTLHEGFSGFAGSLALTVLLIPTVTRGTEEVLKIVPNDLREASVALAAPQWRTVWSVVLPTARSGLITAVLLAIAVALGETAPLLLTIFGNTALNLNLFSGHQEALTLLTYQDVKSSQQSLINLAYSSALILFLMVFIIFVSARILSSDWLGNLFRNALNKRMKKKATLGGAGWTSDAPAPDLEGNT